MSPAQYTISQPFGALELTTAVREITRAFNMRIDKYVLWWLERGKPNQKGNPETTYIELTPCDLGFREPPSLVDMLSPTRRTAEAQILKNTRQRLSCCSAEDFIGRIYSRAEIPPVLTAAMMPLYVQGPFLQKRFVIFQSRRTSKRWELKGVEWQGDDSYPLDEHFLYRVCPPDEVIPLPGRYPVSQDWVEYRERATS